MKSKQLHKSLHGKNFAIQQNMHASYELQPIDKTVFIGETKYGMRLV